MAARVLQVASVLSLATSIRFSNVFQDNMVLQRGDPIEVWGYEATNGAVLELKYGTYSATGKATTNGTWRIILPAMKASLGENMQVSEKGASAKTAVVENVAIGDVFLFTGQSNIDIPEAYGHQFNATAQALEEKHADDLGSSGLVRIAIVPNQVAGLHYNGTPAAELANVSDCNLCGPAFQGSTYQYCQCNSLKWSLPTAQNVRGFSATAWFTGTALLRSSLLNGVPIGLLRSSWGGTKIMQWSSPDALARCPQSYPANKQASALFNGMIHPFIGLRFSAVIWYQGESDTGPNAPFQGPAYYGCALPAMIQDWREKLRQPLPFVVVELSAYCNEKDSSTYKTWCDQTHSMLTSTDYNLPAMRLAQQAAERLPEVYPIAAMDLGSIHPLQGSIHSDKKQPLGMRIANAAFNAVYHQAVPWDGPKVQDASTSTGNLILVRFQGNNESQLQLNTAAHCPSVVLPVYCTGGGFEVYMAEQWVAATSARLGADSHTVEVAVPAGSATPRRIRYAYADWPVVSIRSMAGLPARLFDVNISVASTVSMAVVV